MINKKINKVIMISIILILVFLCLIVFIFNYTKDDSSFSIVEKKWITDNVNNIIDVSIYNDIPIYGYNGRGISFSFLDSFTEDNNIKFNKISYYSSDDVKYRDIAFRVLDSETNLSSNDILFYADNYVVISNEDNLVNSLDSINNIGVLDEDFEVISNYLDKKDCKIYDNIDELVKGLETKEISYFIVPNVMYSRQILADDLNIVYHISDLNKKYVLRVKDDTMFNIFKKYYYKYINDNYIDDYSYEYLDIYFSSTNTSDLLRKSYNSKIYKYGYVVNMPYEDYSDDNFVGTISNYLSDFSNTVNVDIEVVRYNTIDDLKNALVNGDVDFALTNFDYENINMDNYTTLAFNDEDYVVLSKENMALATLKGLRGKKVSVVGSSNLHYLCLSNEIDTVVFDDTNDLIRNINNDSIIVVDKATYIYYQNTKFSSYKVIYEDTIDDAFKFIVNSDNDTFYNLINYYISSRDYRNIRYDYNTDVIIENSNDSLMGAIVIIIGIISVIVVALIIHNRKVKSMGLSKEERIKYIDLMTSLKNRNYLNQNIYKWDDNVIFPQSVIVFDVNGLKDVNDKFGREVGDEIIKKIASILINNQLENTEIIRSGGDEFLIYMIGYDKDSVDEYSKKLFREMKKIPNSNGAAVGYSMILDSVKSVDDAINEAIIMMDKSKNKK